MLKAEIHITLKKTVVDPQGLIIKHALESIGYKGLEEARIGKMITLTLNYRQKKRAEREIREMCKKLLANPIIEEYTFKLREEK
ncbi:MAG: phosphoribosylformylglycinamidine synthase subunit PurS [Candidatus Omnitrophota bacterium]|jgi:phosphoribosylformylglycinamidine synthase